MYSSTVRTMWGLTPWRRACGAAGRGMDELLSQVLKLLHLIRSKWVEEKSPGSFGGNGKKIGGLH